MKKHSLSILAISCACFTSSSYSGTTGPLNTQPHEWTGLYLGASAGYWWSPDSQVKHFGSSGFVNPLFTTSGNDIANTLAAMGSDNYFINLDGFIGGGQIGYNYQLQNQWLIGLETNLDGLTQSKTTTSKNQITHLAHFPSEYYTAHISLSKKLNYLGTVRGRLGYLMTPSLLLYGTGGFAYGGVSQNESFAAIGSLGSPSFVPINAQNSVKQTLTGWSVGGGFEWRFRPKWSAKLEGMYYDLGSLHNNFTLSQLSLLPSQPVVWGAAQVNSVSKFTAAAVRIGLNYHL